MRTRGEGAKKSGIFVDMIIGSSPGTRAVWKKFAILGNSPTAENRTVESGWSASHTLFKVVWLCVLLEANSLRDRIPTWISWNTCTMPHRDRDRRHEMYSEEFYKFFFRRLLAVTNLVRFTLWLNLNHIMLFKSVGLREILESHSVRDRVPAWPSYHAKMTEGARCTINYFLKPGCFDCFLRQGKYGTFYFTVRSVLFHVVQSCRHLWGLDGQFIEFDEKPCSYLYTCSIHQSEKVWWSEMCSEDFCPCFWYGL